jgi:positive phototaxis protein PixI
MDFDAAIAPENPSPPAESPPGPAEAASETSLTAAVEAPPEDQFLQITLNGNLPLLLPGGNLVEIMKLAIGQVVPMFEMAPWVVGIYNWRGDMLWVADLGKFLGFDPWYRQTDTATRHTVVVIKPPYSADRPTADQPSTLGLVVSGVEAMVTHQTGAMEPVPETGAIAPGLRPFLQGACLDGAGRSQLVLAATAVLETMTQAHL